MLTLIDRWRETWRQLELPAAPDEVLCGLLSRYAEQHRRYHTAQHLRECFQKFDELRAEACNPGEIELALWFHDAIYDVRRHDNEEQSAALAAACLSAVGVTDDRSRRVQMLILATRTHDPTADRDTNIMLDVDLSILAADATRFDEYEQQIRLEYQHVAEVTFRNARKEILEKFLRRSEIFRTRTFSKRYEEQARKNLNNAVTKLL